MEFTVEAVESFLTPNQLGKGDFGTTFEGRIGSGFGVPEQLVTIKKSHPKNASYSADLNLKAQFVNEMKLRAINHKNIVKLVGYAESEKHFYLIYERIEGSILEDVIEGEVSWKKTVKILLGIASAIKYLQEHPCGPWVHCDLCPSNIIVNENGSPKLLEFGLCVALGEKKLGGHYGFMHREEKGLASLGTDVFSFGVLGMHLLAKDSQTSFVNKDGVQEPIVNFYLDQWRRTRSIVSTWFGNPKEAIHISELTVRCLHKEKLPPIKDIHAQLTGHFFVVVTCSLGGCHRNLYMHKLLIQMK